MECKHENTQLLHYRRKWCKDCGALGKEITSNYITWFIPKNQNSKNHVWIVEKWNNKSKKWIRDSVWQHTREEARILLACRRNLDVYKDHKYQVVKYIREGRCD